VSVTERRAVRLGRGATARAPSAHAIPVASPLQRHLRRKPRRHHSQSQEVTMPVKHALLALLAERDLTGYELKLRFERVLGEFWQLNSGQVYSTLERLRREGFVARRHANVDRPRALGADAVRAENDDTARAAFTLRPRGRVALEEWLAAPVARLRPIRDPLFVKLAFSGPEHLPALLRAFAHEARRYGEATETLRALVAREPMSHGGRVRWLVAEASRLAYQAQLDWLACVQRTLGAEAALATRRPPNPLRRSAPPRLERREAVA
jgi:DNA-binding PadR family transcriptional regulator